jgi:hypothetical protein
MFFLLRSPHRGLKRLAFFLLSWQGVLGRGSSKQVNTRAVPDGMALNFLGSSYSTRLLFGGMSKRSYAKNESLFKKFMGAFCENASSLETDGFTYEQQTWRLCWIGSLGDWPYHVKSGNLIRNFNCVSKRAISAADPTGICHLCLGGCKNYPWEDTGMNASWIETMEDLPEAWDVDSALLIIIRYIGCRQKAYRFDVWHCWHLGIGKDFIACTLVICLNFVDAPSAEKKFEKLDLHLAAFLKDQKKEEGLSFTCLTQQKLSYNKFTDWPKGAWQKAALCYHPPGTHF